MTFLNSMIIGGCWTVGTYLVVDGSFATGVV